MVWRRWMYCTWHWNRSQHAMERYIGSKSQILPTPPAFDASGRRSPSEYWHVVLYGKTSRLTKIRRYFYSFWQNSRTWQTDGRTDTAWRHRPCLHSIARQWYSQCAVQLLSSLHIVISSVQSNKLWIAVESHNPILDFYAKMMPWVRSIVLAYTGWLNKIDQT